MTTVAEIGALAFNAVAAEITDAIHVATITRSTRGAYSTSTGEYAYSTADQTGRLVVDTVKPVGDVFPEYVSGPNEVLLFLEGFTSCLEGDAITYQGKTRDIVKVQDIVAAGTLFYAVAR